MQFIQSMMINFIAFWGLLCLIVPNNFEIQTSIFVSEIASTFEWLDW